MRGRCFKVTSQRGRGPQASQVPSPKGILKTWPRFSKRKGRRQHLSARLAGERQEPSSVAKLEGEKFPGKFRDGFSKEPTKRRPVERDWRKLLLKRRCQINNGQRADSHGRERWRSRVCSGNCFATRCETFKTARSAILSLPRLSLTFSLILIAIFTSSRVRISLPLINEII